MDAGQRLAFDQAVRQVVAADLDAVLREVGELRKTIALLERAAGLSSDRLPLGERREIVTELRAKGLSERSIARVVGVHRQTVASDARAMRLPAPDVSLGVDGVARRYPQR